MTVRRRVIEELVRLAAVDVPGVDRVGRGGPAWRRWVAGPAVQVHLRDGCVAVQVAIVARPAQPLPALVHAVRLAIAQAVERLPSLELTSLSVVVDGVGA